MTPSPLCDTALSYIRGQMLAILTEEGIFSRQRFGVRDPWVILQLGKEDPAQLLVPALEERAARSSSRYFAQIVFPTLTLEQLAAPCDPVVLEQGFWQEYTTLVMLRWYGTWLPHSLEDTPVVCHTRTAPDKT